MFRGDFICRCAILMPVKTPSSTADIEKKPPVEAPVVAAEEVKKPLVDAVNENDEDPPILKS